MVSIREGRVRLLSARSAPGGTTPEPILLASSCPATACAEEHVRFCLTFDRDGLFSRDTCRKDLDAVAWASRTGPAFVRTRDRRPAPADREAARVAPHGSPGSLEEHQLPLDPALRNAPAWRSSSREDCVWSRAGRLPAA